MEQSWQSLLWQKQVWWSRRRRRRAATGRDRRHKVQLERRVEEEQLNRKSNLSGTGSGSPKRKLSFRTKQEVTTV